MNHDTIRHVLIALLLASGCSLSATAAEEEAGKARSEPTAVGTRTAQWLDLQREGRAAGNTLPVPAAEAGPSYQRYIDSFATPIPETLYSRTPASGAKR
jgi:hypothetical protein